MPGHKGRRIPRPTSSGRDSALRRRHFVSSSEGKGGLASGAVGLAKTKEQKLPGRPKAPPEARCSVGPPSPARLSQLLPANPQTTPRKQRRHSPMSGARVL